MEFSQLAKVMGVFVFLAINKTLEVQETTINIIATPIWDD